MDLRSAITTAARFCWKGKQNSPMKSIRFIPRTTSERPALYAHNGPDGVLIRVDDDLPNAMFDGETVVNAVKSSKSKVLVEKVVNVANAWRINGVHMVTGDVGQYPSLPVVPPAFEPCPDWWVIEQIIPAVSKDKNRPDLMCLNFTEGAVEATDRHRVARAFVQGKWKGLVPAEIFKKLPKGDIEYVFGENMAAFRVGDETRMVMLKTGRFEPCAEALPAQYDGPAYAVDKAKLEEVVKKIKALKAKRLDMRFDPSNVTAILHLQAAGYSHVFDAHEMSPHPNLPVTIGVSTDQLHETLKMLHTPMVRLGFTVQGEPLRIDSGPLVVGLWGFTD